MRAIRQVVGFLFLLTVSDALNILVVFHFAAKSHSTLGNSLARGLAEAGHNVTYISSFADKNPPKNFRDVLLTGYAEEFEGFVKKANFFERNQEGFFEQIEFAELNQHLCVQTLNHPNVKKLLESHDTFDVVIVEQFFNEALKALARYYKAPLIVFSPTGSSSLINEIIANPAPPSYVPDMFMNCSPQMTIWEKLANIYSIYSRQIIEKFWNLPAHDAIIKKYFSEDYDIYDIRYNTSLVLSNTDASIHQAVPKVPNFIHIGGYHVKAPKALPEDLKTWLDNSKEGVVYFSMGSNLRSNNLPPEKREAILKSFGKLKEKVLFKWEDDNLPNLPKNVKVSKWLPQNDLLAHPNIKVFITHGGLLSQSETIYHGVPIICLPVFGDQHLNAKNAEMNGFGIHLPFSDLNEENFSEALRKILTNSSYRDNAKYRSKIFHDKQVKPMDNAVFWVEYVVRHKGAQHLQVAAVRMPLYEYLLLDVLAIAISILLAPLLIIALCLKYLCKKKPAAKPTKKKNQ